MRHSLKHRSLILCATFALGIGSAATAAPGEGNSKNLDRAAKMEQKAAKEAQNKDRATKMEHRTGDTDGERSKEMQARSEERQAAKEQYREEVRSGEQEKVKGKKPWWKLWGSDDGE